MRREGICIITYYMNILRLILLKNVGNPNQWLITRLRARYGPRDLAIPKVRTRQITIVGTLIADIHLAQSTKPRIEHSGTQSIQIPTRLPILIAYRLQRKPLRYTVSLRSTSHIAGVTVNFEPFYKKTGLALPSMPLYKRSTSPINVDVNPQASAKATD